MFAKLTKCLSTGISNFADFSQTQLLRALSKKYPDFLEVLEVLESIDGPPQNEDEVESPDNQTDGRWRPMVLTIGLLYKLQKIEDSREGHWYNSPEIFVRNDDEEAEMLNVFGFYWHLILKVAGVLRSAEADHSPEGQDQIKSMLQEAFNPDEIEALIANATDNQVVEEHCPDFALLLDHTHKLIVINICGTRMIPAPKMSDVFMDLYAKAEPFLNGVAHQGMAIGANNILEKCSSQLNEAADRYPEYGVLVTGYSLGAGICQLVAMKLMQEGSSNVRCISYGAPLVYAGDDQDQNPGKNLFSVVCSHDGLASTSLSTVSKLMAQVRAVDRLQYRKRDMIKLLMQKIETDEGTEMKEEDDSEDDEDFDKDKLSGKPKITLSEDWQRIYDAIQDAQADEGVIKLKHPAKNILVFKRRTTGEVVTRYFQDDCVQHFAESLRLRGAMFNHHMPWSYKSLFAGFGEDTSAVPLEMVQKVLRF